MEECNDNIICNSKCLSVGVGAPSVLLFLGDLVILVSWPQRCAENQV